MHAVSRRTYVCATRALSASLHAPRMQHSPRHGALCVLVRCMHWLRTTMATAITANAAIQQACSAPANTTKRRGRPDDALIPGTRVSSWRVETELGRGG